MVPSTGHTSIPSPAPQSRWLAVSSSLLPSPSHPHLSTLTSPTMQHIHPCFTWRHTPTALRKHPEAKAPLRRPQKHSAPGQYSHLDLYGIRRAASKLEEAAACTCRPTTDGHYILTLAEIQLPPHLRHLLDANMTSIFFPTKHRYFQTFTKAFTKWAIRHTALSPLLQCPIGNLESFLRPSIVAMAKGGRKSWHGAREEGLR